MTKMKKSTKTQSKSPTREPEDTPDPEPPPESRGATSRVTRSAEARLAQLAPATTRENTQKDGGATTIVSQEVPETPPDEAKELGSITAPGTPDVLSTPRRQDEHADANTGETIGHTMGPWAKESPKKPTMGKAGEREPVNGGAKIVGRRRKA